MTTLPYSTRLLTWADSLAPGTFVVPAGYVCVVRDVDISSQGGSVINWEWGLGGTIPLGGGQFTEEEIGQYQEWRGRQIANAGDFIYAGCDGATWGAISGYLLVDLST